MFGDLGDLSRNRVVQKIAFFDDFYKKKHILQNNIFSKEIISQNSVSSKISDFFFINECYSVQPFRRNDFFVYAFFWENRQKTPVFGHSILEQKSGSDYCCAKSEHFWFWSFWFQVESLYNILCKKILTDQLVMVWFTGALVLLCTICTRKF